MMRNFFIIVMIRKTAGGDGPGFTSFAKKLRGWNDHPGGTVSVELYKQNRADLSGKNRSARYLFY